MINQTLKNQSREKTLLLNGPNVQLGTFDNIIYENSKEKYIKIGFSIDFTKIVNLQMDQIKGRSIRPAISSGIKTFTIESKFVPETSDDQTHSAIKGVKAALDSTTTTIEYTAPSFDNTTVQHIRSKYTVNKISPHNRKKLDNAINQSDANYNSVVYPIAYTISRNDQNLDQAENFDVTDVFHFIPSRSYRVSNKREMFGRMLRDTIDDLIRQQESGNFGLEPNLYSSFNKIFPKPFPSIHLKRIKEEYSTRLSESIFQSGNYNDFIRWAQNIPLRTIAKSKFWDISIDALSEAIMSDSDFALPASHEYTIRPYRTRDYGILEQASLRCSEYLSNYIRYIGPLRADPQASQKFNPSSEPDDVGSKGEYAAAVYEANKYHEVQYSDPETKEDKTTRLIDAINFWTNYIGIAHQVKTEEFGQSGFSWQIKHLPSSKFRDLNCVGVGVSQVLPILIAGLLAPHGSILLIEQPELHLHPRAQSKLAEFFLSLINTNRQCVIETHSDTIIHTIRLNLVKNKSLSEKIRIYFAQQSEFGQSSFDQIDISSSGSIVNWPDGFFDETLVIEDKIFRAARKSSSHEA